MNHSLIKRTAAHVQKRLMNDASGHDWHHTYRVWQLAKFLRSKEGGDQETVEVAALLHCAAEHDLRSHQSERMRSYTLMGILDVLEIEGKMREDIIAIAQWCHYKGHDAQRPTTIEGKVVQDANSLETIGAIGLARAFTTGGYLGRVIHDPDIKPSVSPKRSVHSEHNSTTINYIYEKPLQILKLLNTATAKKIAEPRLAFTKEFLKEFLNEWHEGDVE